MVKPTPGKPASAFCDGIPLVRRLTQWHLCYLGENMTFLNLSKISIALLSAALLAACGGPGGGRDDRRSSTNSDPSLQHGALVVKPTGLLLVDMDTNRDMETDRAELARAAPALFAQIDTDSGGIVSGIEFADWAQTALGTRYPVQGLASFDTDNSLAIEVDEFSAGLNALFATYDKDNNGRITRAELFTQLNIDARSGGRAGQGGGPGGGQGGRPGGGGPGGGGRQAG